MDFALTAEQVAFQQELREFLRAEVTLALLDEVVREHEEHSWLLYKKMAARGWVSANIPKEYGGTGKGAVDLAILRYETSYFQAPIAGYTAASRIAHALVLQGNEWQKQTFLPGLVKGEELFCIGYTEPNAGSDLAGLETRAVRQGDRYVVNGTKIFTTGGHLARWIFLACRTAPELLKHRGISVLFVDLKSPGVEIRPLWTLGGWRLNMMVFDNVEVPAAHLIGQENQGWRVINIALDVERTGIQPTGMAARLLDELTAYVQGEPGRRRLGNRYYAAAEQLTRLRVEVDAAYWLALQQAWLQDQGHVVNHESAISKLAGSEVWQKLARLAPTLVGPAAVLGRGETGAPMDGLMETHYRTAVQASIAAGTSEILRNIIAIRGLGLYRDQQ